MTTVMVVDDSSLMRKILIKVFHEHTNLKVIAEAADGKEAVEKYRKHLPDLVTMDMIMPVMNGLEATEEIIAENPDAKIVMVSAINKKQMIITAIKIGAANFVLKPVNIQKTLTVIKEIFGESAVTVKPKGKEVKIESDDPLTEDIVIYLPEEEKCYDNYKSWIDEVEEDLHKELIELWAEKVSSGDMTKQDFGKKIRKIV